MKCACGFESGSFVSGTWPGSSEQDIFKYRQYMNRVYELYSADITEWIALEGMRGLVSCPKCGLVYIWNRQGPVQ